ncbi:hypothetical protein [Aurantimonas endophytica]|uniref:Uncharacterized protein n=1 Tax=Aurantimonas endophytica TaxID=1522175 RepID=A0A7W6HBT4_9HYPH|nr:hypothetical protein [Aurantimonas endophytica]MBB4002335.1 hypothetical protein [Aurantimonas endophytica]MCO6402041.1 hypothetical protein [Aurantimonas endophytica]
MTTGLDTFDNFAWASLLAGSEALVVDQDARRAMRTANALEEAGARATIVPDRATALDRLLRRRFSLAVVSLEPGAPLDGDVEDALAVAGIRLMLLAEPARHEHLRMTYPYAAVATIGLSERALVMLLTGTRDE